MTLTILQFATLFDLAAFTRQVHDKGYRINVQQLTLRCHLSREEVELALEKYSARMLSAESVVA